MSELHYTAGQPPDYLVSADGLAFARLCPLRPGFRLRTAPVGARLSRFAFLRRDGGQLVVESPVVGARVEVMVEDRPDLLWRLLGEAGFLESPAENEPAAEFWEFHDAMFHERSRLGAARSTGATWRFSERSDWRPAVKAPMSNAPIALERPIDFDADAPFQQVLDRRRSLRTPGAQPLTLAQLGQFLHRSVAIRARWEEGSQELLMRPYPSGGAIHELEYYLAVRDCGGLAPGFYHYHALEHALHPLPADAEQVRAMIATAQVSWGSKYPEPQIFFTLATRLPRLAWKYESMAYRIVLINAGAAIQTMYLAATAMGLAPCAVGNGDPALFAAMTGLDPMEETSVAEFALSSAGVESEEG